METKKRLINANDFHDYLEGIRQGYLEEDTLSSDFAADVIETVQDEYLANAPTVDAVEVVRCKDCIANECCSIQIDLGMGGYGYCPKGRRTDG